MLKIIEGSVSDSVSNATRFIVVARVDGHEKGANKISLSFVLPHKRTVRPHSVSGGRTRAKRICR